MTVIKSVEHFSRECFDWYCKKGEKISPAPFGSGATVTYDFGI